MGICLRALFLGLLLLTTLQPVGASPVYVRFNTNLGNIDVELTADATPLNVNNFLSYVNSGAYTNSLVHRSIPGFIWQGGGFTDINNTIGPITAGAAVMGESNFETGGTGALLNKRGTLALALSSGPDSGTCEWFFNEVDNPDLDNTNDQGPFTAFGVVANNASLAVMDLIASEPVTEGEVSQILDPNQTNGYYAPFFDCPLINNSNFIVINSISMLSTQDFVAWQTASFATSPLSSSPTAVNFPDGLSNLEKYLFDINPALPMTGADVRKLPTIGTTTVSGTKVETLTYHQRQNMVGVYITVLTSPDLVTWSPVSSPTIVQTGTDPSTSDPIMQVQVPLTAANKFIRLSLSQTF